MDEKKFDLDELRDAHRILGGLLDDADEGQGVIAWMEAMGRALDAVARFSPGRNALLEACEAIVNAVHAPQKRAAIQLCEAAIRLATGARP